MYVSPEAQALESLAMSLRFAGREEDAVAVERAAALRAEVDEWIACLRCGLAFPSIAAKSAHDRDHR